MINQRDVIRMKIPYPSVSSELAVSSHMYICYDADRPNYAFVKCQTMKPSQIINNLMKHYCDEIPDINRNPFARPTRIDCDKLFRSSGVDYDDRLVTDRRRSVSEDLFQDVSVQLNADGYCEIRLNENDLVKINPLITWI